MNSKEMLHLKLKRDAFIEQYVAARIRWISLSVKPMLDARVQENYLTLYERVDGKNINFNG